LIPFFLFLPRVDPGLEQAWRDALKAWSPYRAVVARVEWNKDVTCNSEWGGGRWIESTRTIVICWPPEHDVGVIVAHEYGHALGLKHVSRETRLSIMNDGWQEPFGDTVTPQDLIEARKLHGGN
jgi:hypothetical protein